jgi:hypothetical protein
VGDAHFYFLAINYQLSTNLHAVLPTAPTLKK